MAAIADVVLQDYTAGSPAEITLVPEYARKDEARWQLVDADIPLVGRTYMHYTRRPADPKTGLVKHSFRVTRPSLKSEVTDPAGPFQPPPTLDFVTVAELNYWVHDRADSDARIAASKLITDFTVTGDNLQGLIDEVVKEGRSIF